VNKKRFFMLVGSLLLALVLAIPLMLACAAPAPTPSPSPSPSPLPTPTPPPAEKVYELRFQHSWAAAENHFFEQYADIVREMSGGQLDVTIFSDGELVPWDEICDAVARGQLDMGQTHPDFYGGVIPVGELEMAPYLWRTLDEEIAVIYKYGMDDIYVEAFEEEYGYHVLDFQLDDFGAFMFNSPVSSLADFNGKVIMEFDPYASILAKLTGASFVDLSAEEMYTAFALGTIDGGEWGGAKCMFDMGFHEVAKYFLLPRHQVCFIEFFFINQDLWNELPSNLQAILREAVRANVIYMRSYYAHGEAKALAAMRDAGVEVLHFPEEDVEAIFQECLRWLTEEYAPRDSYCERAANICLEALRDFGRID